METTTLARHERASVSVGLGGRGAFDGAGDAVQHEPAELHFVARTAREHVAGTCLLYQNATPMVIGQYAPTLYEPTEP